MNEHILTDFELKGSGSVLGFGYRDGSGSGYGSGYGDGYGDGHVYGIGNEYGHGYGYGDLFRYFATVKINIGIKFPTRFLNYCNEIINNYE